MPNKPRPPRSKHRAQLQAMHLAYHYLKYAGFNIGKYTHSATSTNGLTRCVIDWLKYCGHQAERINTGGRMIDRRQTYTDVVGIKRQIGSVEWIKGTSTPGSADISATIQGRSVKIEIKNKYTNDRMSQAQIKYCQAIHSDGGVYIVVDTFDNFVDWYKLNYMTLSKHTTNLTDPNVGRFAVKGQFYEVLSIEAGICTFRREIMRESVFKEDLNKLAERLSKSGAVYYQKGFGREF